MKDITFISFDIKEALKPHVYVLKVGGRYVKYIEFITITGTVFEVLIQDMEGVPIGEEEYEVLKGVLREFVESELLT